MGSFVRRFILCEMVLWALAASRMALAALIALGVAWIVINLLVHEVPIVKLFNLGNYNNKSWPEDLTLYLAWILKS